VERASGESQEGLRIACYERLNAPCEPDVHIYPVLAHVSNEIDFIFCWYHPVCVPSSSGEIPGDLKFHDKSL
jgi:hypothetical protein